MDWKDVGNVIGKAAPVLGAVLGGPVGAIAGAAGSLVAKALGSESTPEAVNTAIQADPEALIKLRELEVQEQGQLLTWQWQQVQADLDNVKDARAREVAMAQAGKTSYATPIIATIVTIGFFVILWLVLSRGIGTMGEAGGMLIGSLSTSFGSVVNYYLGSSLGSATKDSYFRRSSGSGK